LKNIHSISSGLNVDELEDFNRLHDRLNRESLVEISKAETIRIAIKTSLKYFDIVDQIESHIQRLESLYSNLIYLTQETQQALDDLVRLKEVMIKNR
jgi:hypothetical protein